MSTSNCPSRVIAFTKMHSLGNDFVVIDATREPLAMRTNDIALMADRHRGVGFDQMLVAQASERADVDARFRIFNADGSEVDQCGNGARCFAKFLRAKGLTHRNPIAVETRSGQLMTLTIDADESVCVQLAPPKFAPSEIPIAVDAQQREYQVDVDGRPVIVSALSVGNPHAVTRVDDVDRAPVVELGQKIETHNLFPERVNVGFMQIVSGSHLRLRVFERGVGETLACGSGACAAVVAGIQLGLLEPSVAVDLPGGRLNITWHGDSAPILMRGPAVSVYEGRYTPNPQ